MVVLQEMPPRLVAVHLRDEAEPMSAHYKPKCGKPLSPKQDAIMLAVSNGMRNKEICFSLKMAESTLQTHLARIKAKLGARTPEQAAVFFDRARR